MELNTKTNIATSYPIRLSNFRIYRPVTSVSEVIPAFEHLCLRCKILSSFEMSKVSFLNFYNGLSRKPSVKSTPKESMPKERQNSSVPRASRSNVQEMRQVFDKFDTNKDGKISQDEYNSALSVLGKGFSKAEMAKSFRFIDTDKDGYIDFKEFIEMMHDVGDNRVKKNDIQAAFQLFDLNGDKKISAEELMEVLRKMGEKYSLDSCRKMIRGVDADGDGLIDMDEFMTMMTRNVKVA